MGLYLGLATKDYAEHPDFPVDKWACNRGFIDLVGTLPVIKHCLDAEAFEEIHRPTDFALWREAAARLPVNQELFTRMIDAMEADDRWWIHVSY